MTSFGVGFSELSNSFDAGVEAAKKAMHQGINPYTIKLCFLFCTSRHTPHEFWNGVKSVTGQVAFIGGYANGTISNVEFGYDGFQSIVGLLSSTSIETELFLQQGIAFNEYYTGKRLGQKIHLTQLSSPKVIMIFFDAVNRLEGRFQMNYGTPLIKGLYEMVKKMPTTAGARLMGDMKFKNTYQWLGDQMVQNAALAVAFAGNLNMDIKVLHGCTPASAYHTITKVEGATIMEIDYKPAIDFVSEILGPTFNGDYQQLKFL